MIDREVEQLLKERALRLAQAEGQEELGSIESVVAFMVSGQCFGVPLGRVRHAGRLRHMTPLPGGSSYLLGITVMAGHLVSVLDVASFLDLRKQGLGDVSCCLVVHAGGRQIGLAAEQLIGIEDVPAKSIVNIFGIGGVAGAGAASGPAVVSRAAMLDRLRILLIDLEPLMADKRLGGGPVRHG
jgi:chemotaxis signal transduction protein